MRRLPMSPRIWLNRAYSLAQPRQHAAEKQERLRAIALYEQGDAASARQVLRHQVEVRARTEWTWLWLARFELASEATDLEAVTSALTHALTIRPGWPLAIDLQKELGQAPMMVPVLGLQGAALVEVSQALVRELAPKSVVVITNAIDFRGLHLAGIDFEYMPTTNEVADLMTDERLADYERRRSAELAEERNATLVAPYSSILPSTT